MRNKRGRTKSDAKNKIIKRQSDEIESLRSQIEKLNIDNANKDELIYSVDHLREEFEGIIDNLKSKEAEYDKLIADLRLMRKAFDREVFANRWWIVKRLMKV